MGLYVNNDVASGATIFASDHNEQGSRVAAVLNGGIDNSNINAGAAIATSKLADDAGITTAKLNDGAVTPAKLQSGTGSSWAWQSWTPTWTNLTIGASTQVARYVQTGKTVHFELSIVQGSGGSVGSSPNFSLPVAISSNYITGSPNGGYIGDNALLNASTAVYNGRNRILSTTTLQLEYLSVSASNVVQSDVTATAPFTFATGSKIFVWGFYEAA